MQQDRRLGENINPLYSSPVTPEIPADLQAALGERYTLRRVLGRGGMATVYLAYDGKHRREVAVKVLLPGLAAFLGVERFLKEIQIAARRSSRDWRTAWPNSSASWSRARAGWCAR
jgi:serine/threonine protein kinase